MTQPEIRFNGFSDEWVEKKLGDVLKERKATQPQSNDAPLVSFTVENGVTPKTDRYDREGLVTGDKYAKRYKLTLLDDIVYNPANLKFGAISRNKFGKAVFSPIYVTYFQKDGDSDMRFVEMIVTSDSFIKHVRKYEQGTVYERQSVSSSDMLKAVIQLPTLPEQQKIGALFSKYDAIISLREQKLAELNALKKGMLQQMFDNGSAASHKPQVRFNGFSDEWVEKKLGEIGDFKSGVGFPVSEQGGTVGHPFYKVSDMNAKGNDVELISANNYVSDDQIRLKNWKSINTLPAIVFAKVGAALLLNRKRIVEHPFLIDNNLMAYSFDKSWGMYFGKTWFDTVNLPKYAQTGALPSFNASDIKRIHVLRPTLPEQQKIGQLFKHLDARISNEQSKIEQLKAQKQGLLQKML